MSVSDFKLVIDKHALNMKQADVALLIHSHKLNTGSDVGVMYKDAIKGICFDSKSNNWKLVNKSVIDFLNRDKGTEQEDYKKEIDAFRIDPEIRRFFFNTVDRSKSKTIEHG